MPFPPKKEHCNDNRTGKRQWLYWGHLWFYLDTTSHIKMTRNRANNTSVLAVVRLRKVKQKNVTLFNFIKLSRLWFGDTQTSFATYQKKKKKKERNLYFINVLCLQVFLIGWREKAGFIQYILTLWSTQIANLPEIEKLLKQLLPWCVLWIC